MVVTLAFLFAKCELLVTCASCVDPDHTIFVFDTTAAGFTPEEIDSFYIVRFPRGESNMPIDTTSIVNQNPFIISGSLFGSSTLNEDYIVEGLNQEFSFAITNIDYAIINSDDDCNCDNVVDKTLRVNGSLISLTDPFQTLILQK
ncbi:MAG: hypothetical protein ACR2MX_14395 [Cyclobacteriaceae bacterium]